MKVKLKKDDTPDFIELTPAQLQFAETLNWRTVTSPEQFLRFWRIELLRREEFDVEPAVNHDGT